MKTGVILSGLVLSVNLLISCTNIDCIDGSGNQVSLNRKSDPFTRVEVSGSINLVLKQDSLNSIRILADDNIQDEINIEVKGDKLIIDMNRGLCDPGNVTVYLSSVNFEGVEGSGAVGIQSDGKLNVQDFDLDLQGASKVNLDLNAANLRTSSSGSSEIVLMGQAGTHEIELTGAGSLDAFDFVVGRYFINSSGASHSKINVINELEVNSTGASEVEYKGKPGKIIKDNSGASSLRNMN